jgi:hypothetical protein
VTRKQLRIQEWHGDFCVVRTHFLVVCDFDSRRGSSAAKNRKALKKFDANESGLSVSEQPARFWLGYSAPGSGIASAGEY